MGHTKVRIEPLQPRDWQEVRRILKEGIATGQATFETEAPSWETWDRAHLPGHRLVASLRLHRSAGFREVGRRERIGGLHGAWRDTVLLERRSEVVG